MSKRIGIYFEHPKWFEPLFAELNARGLDYERIEAASHFFDPAARPAFDLLFNRMSASAYLRGNGDAIFHTRGYLANLERQGVRVINGYDAYQVEISKALQASLLSSLGLKTPRTRVVNSTALLSTAAEGLRFPIVVKPNIGGRGAGIVKLDTAAELRTAVEQKAVDLGIDSTALVQEFVPKRGAHINRVETLGGKFLYALKIFPEGENFNLCPAEVCLTENESSAEICLADPPASGLRIESFTPPPEIIEAVESIVIEAGIDVGGVEYLIDDRTGEALFYDINALSNFVANAERLVGFDPHEKLADFLERELEKCATDTGCLSSAAG